MDSDSLPLLILRYDAKDLKTNKKHVSGDDEVGKSLSLIGYSSSSSSSSRRSVKFDHSIYRN
jgi:hypothetical protein